MSSEKQITDQIITFLRSEGFWVMKVHGGPMQTAGLPDILACRAGQFWAFEVKKPGGKVTPLQEKRLCDLARAGAKAFVVRSVEEVAILTAAQQLHTALERGQ